MEEDRACKKVLCTLITEAYFRSFKNKYTGYANVQCLEILSHLWSTYGVLQDYEVQENDVKMKKYISAETLFEEFVEQIETAVDAVATQVTYTRQQIVSIAFTIVENAGIYYDGIKEWRQKYTADKTWESFKTFFAKRVQRDKYPSKDISVGRLWENNQHEVKMKKAISAETLFEDFVEQIETAVDSVATQFPYISGERRDILRWRKGVASKGYSRQDMGSIQDVFCKRVQREQEPAKNISVGRLWANNQHESRTCKRRGIQ